MRHGFLAGFIVVGSMFIVGMRPDKYMTWCLVFPAASLSVTLGSLIWQESVTPLLLRRRRRSGLSATRETD